MQRLIACVYHWPPSEMDRFTLDELTFWYNSGKSVLKGSY